jgi:hypothetical protein
MRLLSFVLVPLIVAGSALDVEAGILRRTPKPKPEERVPELIETLTSSTDDHKRADAAAELGSYDGKAFPQIIPTLIGALKNDSNSSVRWEAARSIGELRPISQQAGAALELAASKDSALIVRAAATRSLTSYHIFGYRPNKTTDPVRGETEEPPLADPIKPISTPRYPANPMQMPQAPPAPMQVKPAPTPPLINAPRTQTTEPPLSLPPAAPLTLPAVPDFPIPAIPSIEPQFKPAPAPVPEGKDDGPALTPPK